MKMNKGDLLHIGTAYVEVHTFKGKDYVTVRDFSTTTKALSKEILELEEENKKLKSDLSECECSMHYENDEVGYRKRECKKLNIKVASLEGEVKGLNYTIEKLKEENQTLELWLDNKEKLNEEYRKQIDKLRTDNVYEEGLYD